MIEVVFVGILMATLSLIVAPKIIRSVFSWKIDYAAREIQSDLRSAAQLAVTEFRDYRVEFAPAGDSYTIQYDSGGGSFVTLETKTLDAGVDLTSTTFTSDRVDFDRFGAPSAGGNVLLVNQYSRNKTVVVETGTGIAKIQ